MRCRGLHDVANPAYLSHFLFFGLPNVAPYCVRDGVRVVSKGPWRLTIDFAFWKYSAYLWAKKRADERTRTA
jgi:hypothetical protein